MGEKASIYMILALTLAPRATPPATPPRTTVIHTQILLLGYEKFRPDLPKEITTLQKDQALQHLLLLNDDLAHIVRQEVDLETLTGKRIVGKRKRIRNRRNKTSQIQLWSKSTPLLIQVIVLGEKLSLWPLLKKATAMIPGLLIPHAPPT